MTIVIVGNNQSLIITTIITFIIITLILSYIIISHLSLASDLASLGLDSRLLLGLLHLQPVLREPISAGG